MSKRITRITASCGVLILLITCAIFLSKTPLSSWPIDAISRAEANAIINGPDIPGPTPVTPEAFRAAFHDDEAPSLLEKLTAEEMFQRFGEPLVIRGAYYSDYKIYTRAYLPLDYYVTYPGGIELHIGNGMLEGIAYHEPGHSIAGKVQVGSTVDEVYALVGPPASARKMGMMIVNDMGWRWRSEFEGVIVDDWLYWRTWRQDIGLLFSFREHRVARIFFLPTRLTPFARYTVGLAPKASIARTFRETLTTQIASTGNWWHSWSKSPGCESNLKQLGAALEAYSSGHERAFPHLDPRPGQFVFQVGDIIPKYASNTNFLVCPNMAPSAKNQGDSSTNPALVGKQSYWYLGYAVLDEREGLGLLAAYRDAAQNHRGFGHDLPIPYRARPGTFGHTPLLQQGVERLFNLEINNPAAGIRERRQIPVIIERPGHHWRQGGYVLFMDGHVEWRDYPGPFPMTPAFIEGLINLEKEFSAG